MSKDCDCYIGDIVDDRVYISTLEYEVERIITAQPIFKKYGMMVGEFKSRMDIIYGNRSCLSKFMFCPYCGVKINWKEITKIYE